MTGPLVFWLAGGSAVLAALALAAGPMIGAGAMAGAFAVAVVFRWPAIGLSAMIVANTTLQIIGSEALTGLPIGLSKASGLVTVVALALRSAVYGTRLTFSSQWLPVAGFALVMAISALTAADGGLARDGLFRYAQIFLLLFVIALIAGESRRALDVACITVVGCMTACAIIGLLEFFLPSLAIESDDPSLAQGGIGAILDHDSIEGVDVKRITGGLSDSNWFAYFVVSFLPLNLYLFQRYSGVFIRLAIAGAAALQSVGIVLSLTRSAIIAGGLGLFVLLVRRRLPLAPVLGLLTMGAVGFLVWNPPGLQRLYSPEYARAGSTPLREELLWGGWSMIQDRPLLGRGYSEFGPAFMRWLDTQQPGETIELWADDVQRRVDDGEEALENIMPHNTAIQLTVEYGLPGLGFFCLYLAGIVRDAGVARRYGTANDALLSDCLVAGLWTFAGCALFGHLAMLKLIWIMGGLAAATRRVALAAA